MKAIPSLEQLILLIANGDDSKTNTIILNKDGIFELIEFDSIDISIDNPRIIARNEAYIADYGYIGIEASKDERFINDLYNENLECWLIYLQTNRTNMFADGIRVGRSTEEILKEIQSI